MSVPQGIVNNIKLGIVIALSHTASNEKPHKNDCVFGVPHFTQRTRKFITFLFLFFRSLGHVTKRGCGAWKILRRLFTGKECNGIRIQHHGKPFVR